jgi:hypothetical protein
VKWWFRSRGELSNGLVQSPCVWGRASANCLANSSQKVLKQKMTKAFRSTLSALAHERYFDVFEPNIHITHGRALEMLSKVMSGI